MATSAINPPGAESGFTVGREGQDLVLRFPLDLVSPDEMTELVDYFFLEYIRRKSSLSDEQVAELADEIDQGVWERLRPMVEAKLRDR